MDKELAEMLAGVIDRNTTAMEKAADASEKMAHEVKHLRASIQGTQRLIGGELGPAIDQAKKAAAEFQRETADVVASRRGQGGDS